MKTTFSQRSQTHEAGSRHESGSVGSFNRPSGSGSARRRLLTLTSTLEVLEATRSTWEKLRKFINTMGLVYWKIQWASLFLGILAAICSNNSFAIQAPTWVVCPMNQFALALKMSERWINAMLLRFSGNIMAKNGKQFTCLLYLRSVFIYVYFYAIRQHRPEETCQFRLVMASLTFALLILQPARFCSILIRHPPVDSQLFI